MNRKTRLLFLSMIMIANYSFSQENSQQEQYDDTFSADAENIDNADYDEFPDYDQRGERDAGVDNSWEQTPQQLEEIATNEANKDLVGLIDTLDSGEKKQEVSFENDQQEAAFEGIDTVDLDQPQGNWLFKRIWWERSEARYEKIKQKIEEIFEKRMIFFEKRSALVKNILDPFYVKIGMGQGEFQAILTDRIQFLEKEREKKGSLTQQERDVLQMLEKEREALDRLVADVQAIGEIENRVDESLSLLIEQIKAIRSYDMQAWDAFKEIARVIDDEKARQLYYVVETSWRNIKEIGDYLGHSFAAHFDQLISTAREQTDRVTHAVAALKEKGIDFKKQVEELVAPKPVEKVIKQEVESEEPEEEQGFFSSYIINPLSSLWSGVVSVVTWPYYALFGPKEEDESESEEE